MRELDLQLACSHQSHTNTNASSIKLLLMPTRCQDYFLDYCRTTVYSLSVWPHILRLSLVDWRKKRQKLVTDLYHMDILRGQIKILVRWNQIFVGSGSSLHIILKAEMIFFSWVDFYCVSWSINTCGFDIYIHSFAVSLWVFSLKVPTKYTSKTHIAFTVELTTV